MSRLREHSPLLEVAERFVDRCLKRDDSLFTPGRPVWSLEHINEFHHRFVMGFDPTPDISFGEKLERQLEGADDGTLQFVGELLAVHLLAIRDMGVDAKQELIQLPLGRMREPVAIPHDISPALEVGLSRYGSAHMHRYFQIVFLVEFLGAWKGLGQPDRERLLGDLGARREWLAVIPAQSAGIQREALTYFLFPHDLEPIVSNTHKQAIAKRFSYLVSDDGASIDAQLSEIRAGLSGEFGERFDFYDPLIRPAWDPNASRWDQFISWAARFFRLPIFDDAERKYKLDGASHIQRAREKLLADSPDWLDDLKRGFQPPMNLTNWREYDPFFKWCAANRDEADELLRKFWDTDSPLHERLDLLHFELSTETDIRSAGRISLASQLLFGEDPYEYPFYRATVFANGYRLTGYDPPVADLSQADRYLHAIAFADTVLAEARSRGLQLRDRLDAQSVIWAVQGWGNDQWPQFELQELERFRTGKTIKNRVEVDDLEKENGTERIDTEERTLRSLAEGLLIDLASLQSIKRLLLDKRQIIFFGPPGTGKTYIATRLAEFLAGTNDRVDLVQFHAAYAYEDFVEGFRPREINGRPGFELQSGPLKRIAQRAAEHPDQTYVLIIDEINRANIARVFGELYFLLEYRSHEISLQYSEDTFALPENLLIIGTMNTADRSIALIDAALRRRFYFIPFFPTDPPIEGILGRWLNRNRPEMFKVADLVDQANAMLDDRHGGIGPSYFMRADLDDTWVELIWNHQIMPYLEEYFFGEPDRLDDFRVESLQRRNQFPPSVAGNDDSIPDDDSESTDPE